CQLGFELFLGWPFEITLGELSDQLLVFFAADQISGDRLHPRTIAVVFAHALLKGGHVLTGHGHASWRAAGLIVVGASWRSGQLPVVPWFYPSRSDVRLLAGGSPHRPSHESSSPRRQMPFSI